MYTGNFSSILDAESMSNRYGAIYFTIAAAKSGISLVFFSGGVCLSCTVMLHQKDFMICGMMSAEASVIYSVDVYQICE